MSGQKTLFRGASYTRNPKSVLCLAGHLKSGSPYKAVYNIRSWDQDSGVLAGLRILGFWLDYMAVWMYCRTLPAVWSVLLLVTCCMAVLLHVTLTVLMLVGCTVARYLDCLAACMTVLLHVTCYMAVLLLVTCCMA